MTLPSPSKKDKRSNVLVPISEHDGELLVPSNVVGSHGLVVGMNDEGSSKTVGVLPCERKGRARVVVRSRSTEVELNREGLPLKCPAREKRGGVVVRSKIRRAGVHRVDESRERKAGAYHESSTFPPEDQ